MKTLKILFVILIGIFLSSCAVHFGNIDGDASLSSANFKMVRLANGSATTKKIFGLGGLGKDALVLEAKKDLLQNNPLKEGQALANVTVDFKNSFILFVNTQKVTITADVVEFYDKKSPNPRWSTKPEVEVKSEQIDDVSEPKVDVKSGQSDKTSAPGVEVKSEQIDNVSVPKVDVKSRQTDKTSIPGVEVKSEHTSKISVPVETKNDRDTIIPATDNPTIQPVVPTIRYSESVEIVTSSGEHFKVEAGDYFIGKVDINGKPENGKLYDVKGQQKHIILPKRNQ